jgi:hypothetical protein
MTDIVERIRGLLYVHVPVASQLMEEAATEIERLRNGGVCPHVRGKVTQYCSLNFTLSDAEREVVARLADRFEAIGNFDRRPSSPGVSEECERDAATLRSLLERLHT